MHTESVAEPAHENTLGTKKTSLITRNTLTGRNFMKTHQSAYECLCVMHGFVLKANFTHQNVFKFEIFCKHFDLQVFAVSFPQAFLHIRFNVHGIFSAEKLFF